MTTSQYLIGAAELAVIIAALGLGAFYVRALLVPAWTGALARLAEAVLGISALILTAELIGVLGLLEEVPLVLACTVVGLAAAQFGRSRGAHAEPEAPEVKPTRVMMGVAVLAAALVVAHWAQPTGESLDRGMYYQDTTWYHMSFSARFADTGHVGPLHFTDPLKLAAWYYPQNSELLHAIGIVTLDSDFLSPLINLAWVALSLLAAWCIGRPFGVGAVTLFGAAVVLDSEMLVASQAGNAPNDIAGVFFLLATIAFLVNGAATARAAPEIAIAADHPIGETDPDMEPVPATPAPDREEFPQHPEPGPIEEVPVSGDPRVLAGIGTGPLFLAALAAGGGIGTKITLLAALGALTIGIAYLGYRQGHWLRALGVWLGGMVITSGFWYGRNLIKALTPFPQIEKLGPIDLPGPQQIALYPRAPHKLSEYINDPLVWQHKLFPVLLDRLGPLWPVILLTMVVGLFMALFYGRTALMRVLAVTGIVAGLAYLVTPLTASGDPYDASGFDANLRYVAPVLVISFVLLPLVPALRHRPWPWALIGFFGVLILVGTITQPNWTTHHLDESAEVAILLIAVPAGIVAAARAGVSPPALAGVGLLAVVATVAIGKVQSAHYLDHRYESAVAPPLTGGFRASPEWTPLQDWGRSAKNERIGVVGRASAFGQYFFYGNDLSNWVQYVGQELRRGTYRPIRKCADWREAINEGNYDYVVTTPQIGHSEIKAPLENLWTEGPNTKTVISSGPARVFKIEGPLDPSTCAKLGVDSFQG